LVDPGGAAGIALNEFGVNGGEREMIGKTELLDREEDNCEQKTARKRSTGCLWRIYNLTRSLRFTFSFEIDGQDIAATNSNPRSHRKRT
jgi:hypothetical protein